MPALFLPLPHQIGVRAIDQVVAANRGATQECAKFHAIAVGQRHFGIQAAITDGNHGLYHVSQLLVTTGIPDYSSLQYRRFTTYNITRVALHGMHIKMHPLPAVSLKGLHQKSMQATGARPGIDLGFYLGDTQLWKAYPFPPAQDLAIFRLTRH